MFLVPEPFDLPNIVIRITKMIKMMIPAMPSPSDPLFALFPYSSDENSPLASDIRVFTASFRPPK